MMEAAAKLDLDELFEEFGAKEFFPSDAFQQEVAKLCNLAASVCQNVLFQIMGKNPTEGHNVNMSRLELVLYNFPAGTSVKNMGHWAQMMRSGKFARFDYGSSGNSLRYGQTTPPEYDLSKLVTTPIATFTGGYDPLADPMDAEQLEAILSDNNVLVYAHKEEEYDHADFAIGLDAHERIYPLVIDLIWKYTK
eukprot:TRINITY_DN5610_c0_g1_i5.p1 TRINITY_DN5610_c0_g1~~TRINITY_DN5610_c0_g1_i5.p1  ORF type:complete len:193 (-),score=55.91 TRINITY_DN5610_c0_g1_i5:72-650(-)